jgi:2-polyprenyl-6-methoxyphenol hydroxylase-like FAD-dependent oxidoreductase
LAWSAQVASRAVEIPRQRFCDQRGRLLCEVDVAELWAAVGPCLALHRADVHALLDALDAAADIHVSTIEEVALDRWAHERVVLIGDAAHATSPNMAQGAAMALEDALVLTDCLQRIPAIPGALAAFEARRRPRTDWVRAQTHRRDHTQC